MIAGRVVGVGREYAAPGGRRRRAALFAAALVLSTLTGLAARPALAQATGTSVSEPGPTIVLQADPISAGTFVPPPPSTFAATTVPGTAGATFEATLSGLPAEAQVAFERATQIWAGLIVSSVPIKVAVSFEPLNVGTLATARTDRVRDFRGAPMPDTFYALALANALAGYDVSPGAAGIAIRFNSDLIESWYFGTDGRPPSGRFDFVSVALHEIGHGLGFEGTMRASGDSASWGTAVSRSPSAYDRFTADAARVSLLDPLVYPNFSPELLQALTSDRVYFDSPSTNAGDGTGRPKLYAPAGWIGGSSYVHLDERSYPPGNPNSLMTPNLARDETVQSPGPITLCILEAVGWSTPQTCPAASAASTTTLSSRVVEAGDDVIVGATGVGSAHSSYTLRLGTTAFNCPIGPAVGGTTTSDGAFNIPEVRRVLPAALTSGNRWLCWVRTGDPGDWSTPVRITIL